MRGLGNQVMVLIIGFWEGGKSFGFELVPRAEGRGDGKIFPPVPLVSFFLIVPRAIFTNTTGFIGWRILGRST